MSAEQMAACGYEPDDFEPFEVWPENWPAFALFSKLSTQWRVGMNGATGLAYSSVFGLIDRLGLPPDEQEAMFDDIQRMELAALDEMKK